LKPLLLALLDEVQILRHEVETLRQMFENEKPKAKKSPKGTVSRLPVGLLLLALQIKYPEKVWTSDSFAKEIGCSGAAVRQTQEWENYQKRLQNERQEHRPRKGYRDEQGNIDAFVTDDKDVF
jgi:molecular chaperone GrpE (heat shock protein)